MSVSLDTIVNVTVQVSNPTSIVSDFNLGMIIGSSAVLTALDRTRQYSIDNYQVQMVADGFTTASGEYLATQAYFSQSPSPSNVIIGVKLTDETDAEAFTACRLSNNYAYAVSFAYATVDANIQAVSTAVEASPVPTIFFFSTLDPKCLIASQTNILKTLQDAKYNRTCGFYSTKTNFINGVMGLFCGLNSMLSNSAYTFAYKTISGFVPEDLSGVQTQALTGYNGNVYTQFGRRYNLTYPGVMSSGYHVDEQFMIDAIKFLIQQGTISGLVNRKKIPQTEQGITDLISFITEACETLRTTGFISDGIWTGGTVLELSNGDAIPGGYLIQAGSLSDQPAADRQSRISPPIYVAIKSSGAIEHVVVMVYVNQ